VSPATGRLRLARLTYDDAGFILELLNEPSFKRYIGDKGVDSLDDARAYLRDVPLAQYKRFGYGLYRVSIRDDDTAAGICGLVKRDEFPEPDLGFAFLKAHWSNGYALESSRAVLEEARDRFELRRILAMADKENVASVRLLEKLGFQFECMVTMPGETHEICQYAIEDW
jgi:ribosomal-protein-alanine N-acetyltransferase